MFLAFQSVDDLAQEIRDPDYKGFGRDHGIHGNVCGVKVRV